MTDLIERLRQPDWHDPECPFKVHCHCGGDDEPPPHDHVRHPDAIEAADRIEALEKALREIIEFADEPDVLRYARAALEE